MIKTPISILMEYIALKRLKAPVFEEMDKFGPLHQPTFRIRIIFNGVTAEGQGKSKQDAKQQAAENLLNILGIKNGASVYKQAVIDKDINDNSINSLVNGAQSLQIDEEVNFNAIGSLTELCRQHKFPMPDFKILKVDGPDHLKVFTMQCTVSPIEGVGTSNKKQKAMHIAASKVLKQIEKELEEKKELRRIQAVKKATTRSPDAIIKKYNQIKNPIEIDQSSENMKNSYRNYEKIQENSSTLQQLINDEVDVDDPCKIVEKITDELGVKLVIKAMNTNQLKGTPNSDVSMMKLTTTPPVISLGYNVQDAAENLIDSLKVLCG